MFRGGAKSTIAEEAIIVKLLFREFRNGVIVGENAERACDRLHAIKIELETNDRINKIFGDLVGPIWAVDEIVTSTGVRLKALGRGQALRGIKYEDSRPDLFLGDDLEGRGDIATPEARKKVRNWVDLELMPALEPGFVGRMLATPMHPEALPYHMTTGAYPWPVHKFPIYTLDVETGERVATWPDRFPLTEREAIDIRHATGNTKVQSIERLESSLVTRGQISGWMSEYMCEAESPESKAFKAEMLNGCVFPRVKSWQATYSMTDPARTVGAKAATTGHVDWSWIKSKLVIWDAWGKELMPDEIIKAMFDANERFNHVLMGFEEDGLNQWALQPIRQEMVRRGHPLPLKAVRAPAGKLDFIRGLQPFFAGREVEFATELPDLKMQLLGFPSGRIDVPNALAYALKMRPGAPIYDDFGVRNVDQDIRPAKARPLHLVLNASRSLVSGIVLQTFDGAVRVFGDFIREGEAASVLPRALADLQVQFGRADLRLYAGPLHFDTYRNVGLVAAARRIPRDVQPTLPADRGRPQLTDMLQREHQGMPLVMVSEDARWTLNAFVGGYSRVLLPQGQLADYAEEGPYRLLMEGLESYTALMELGSTDGFGRASMNAETAQGRRYKSMLGGDDVNTDTKGDWGVVLKGGR